MNFFIIISDHQTLDPDTGSGSAIGKHAGSRSVSGSALNQCGSATLEGNCGYLGHDLGGGLLELGNLLGGGVHLNSLGLPLHRLLLPKESTGKIKTERTNAVKVKI